MNKLIEQPELVLSKQARKEYEAHRKRYEALHSLHTSLQNHFDSVVRGHVPSEIAPKARAIVMDSLTGGTNFLTGVSLLANVSMWAAMAPLFFAGWRVSELLPAIRKRTDVMSQLRDHQLVLASGGKILSSKQVAENRNRLNTTLAFLARAKDAALKQMDSVRD